MPLNFEKVISAASNGTQNFLGNEPDGNLYHYYVTDEKTSRERYASPEYADYDSLSWSEPADVCMTPREVQHIGVKNFPQIGSIGFYRLAYLDRSRVMVPLHVKKDKQEQPVLEAAADESTKTIVFTITPPANVSYDCYRIEMVRGPMVISHIAYEHMITVPYPEAKGEYQCFAIGYLQEGQICSKDSNAVTLTLPGNIIDADSSVIVWRKAVASYAELISTYPEPKAGWTVTAMDTGMTYRFNGSEWLNVDVVPESSAAGAPVMIEILFSESFKGMTFTVTGEGESYTGSVADNFIAQVSVESLRKEYTITCNTVNGNEISVSTKTGMFYGIYDVSMEAVLTSYQMDYTDKSPVTYTFTPENSQIISGLKITNDGSLWQKGTVTVYLQESEGGDYTLVDTITSSTENVWSGSTSGKIGLDYELTLPSAVTVYGYKIVFTSVYRVSGTLTILG